MNSFLAYTFWIDVCQSDANLMASGGYDKAIKIFDKRESKIVKTFEGIHSGKKFHSIFVVIRYLSFVFYFIYLNFSFMHFILIVYLKIF